LNVDALAVDCRRCSLSGSGGGSRWFVGGRFAQIRSKSAGCDGVTDLMLASKAPDRLSHHHVNRTQTGFDPRWLRDQFKCSGSL